MSDDEPSIEPAPQNEAAAAPAEALSEEKLRDFMQGYVGQVRPALLEHAKAGHPMSGFTDNYIRIQVDAPAQLDNTIVNVRLDAVTDDGEAMRATLVTEQ